MRLDARDKEAVFHLIQGLDRLDVLVNAQGVVPVGGLLEATDQDWEEAFLLNAKSVFWAMQAALPKMAAQGGEASSTSPRWRPSRWCPAASSIAPPRPPWWP